METWDIASAMGSGGALRIRGGPLHLLSSNFLDSRLTFGLTPAVETCDRGLCLDSPHNLWLLHVFLARQWMERNEAIFAALFYVANPYFLVIIYWRSAFAELLAGALIPLLVLAAFRRGEKPGEIVLPLALIVAAAWLINVPSAIMVTYSAAFFILALAVSRQSIRVLAGGAAGILLGAMLAGFYLVPAIYEQKWISVSQVLSEGYRAQDNFLFGMTADPDHNLFNHLISIVALAEVI